MNKNKTINFSDPWVSKKKFLKNISNIFKKNFYNEGEITKNFEKKIANLVKAKYAVAASSGSACLYIALKSLCIKKNDEVIIPNITFQATANAVNLIGAKLVLCDIKTDTLLMDEKDLKKKITKKTKAIIYVNVSGRGSNIIAIKKIAKAKKIYLIEDSSEALFSKYKKKFYGTYGDIGCYSFAPNKIITTGQGGMLVTNNLKLYKKFYIIKNQGKTKKNKIKPDEFDSTGFNFRSTNLDSALGLAQFENIKFRIKKLKQIYSYYKKNIYQNKNIKIIEFKVNQGELPLWTELFCKKKEMLIKHLKNKEIHGRSLWKPISETKPYKMNINNFINTKKIYNKVFWLPSSLKMKMTEQKKICNLINKFMENYN